MQLAGAPPQGEEEEEEEGHAGTQELTWYVLSKLSYMNRVISDVFPTVKQEERGSAVIRARLL